jgi:predicted PurR-regulated permease PerM
MDVQEARQALPRETPLTRSDNTPNGLHEQFFEKSISLLLVAVLLFACVQITAPFLQAFTWAIILTVSTWPLFLHLRQRLGERKKLAATVMTITLALAFLLPGALLVASITDSISLSPRSQPISPR